MFTNADWQPIDTAPKDGTKLLLALPELRYYPAVCPPRVGIGYWHRQDSYNLVEDKSDSTIMRKVPTVEFEGWTSGRHLFACGHDDLTPTHWMPLPEVPATS